MFYRIIFKWLPKLDTEAEFIAQWERGSRIIQSYPGALGTKLFRDKNNPRILYGMAEWESKDARDRVIAEISEREDADYLLHGHEQFLEEDSSVVIDADFVSRIDPS